MAGVPRAQFAEWWRQGRARLRASGLGAWGRRWRARVAASGLWAHWHRWRPRLRTAGFVLGGATLALVLFGRVGARVGPFDATVAARPALSSQTTVHLAPLGTIVLHTHHWPLALDLRVDQIGL